MKGLVLEGEAEQDSESREEPKWSVRETESLEEYIRYLWPNRDLIHNSEHVYVCTTQSNAENITSNMRQKIETLLNCNIEYMSFRERNRGSAMASSWYSVPNEYNKMHEKE